MSDWQNQKESESINVQCPKCDHSFNVDVEAEAEVEIPNLSISVKIKNA